VGYIPPGTDSADSRGETDVIYNPLLQVICEGIEEDGHEREIY
jgi:hypothetical protein